MKSKGLEFGALGLAILLIISTIAYIPSISLAQPKDQYAASVEVRINAAEQILAYVNETFYSIRSSLSQNVSGEIEAKLGQLRLMISEAVNLYMSGEYDEAVDILENVTTSCYEIYLTLLNLSNQLKTIVEEKIEEAKEEAKANITADILERLREIADSINDTELLSYVEEKIERIRRGDVDPGIIKEEIEEKIKEIRERIRLNITNRVRAIVAKYMEKFSENITEYSYMLNNYTDRIMEQITAGNLTGAIRIFENLTEFLEEKLMHGIENIEKVIEHIDEVIEHLKETNASDVAIAALEMVKGNLQRVLEHLAEVKEKVLSLIPDKPWLSANHTKEMMEQVKEHLERLKNKFKGKLAGNETLIDVTDITYPHTVVEGSNVTLSFRVVSYFNSSLDLTVKLVTEDNETLASAGLELEAWGNSTVTLNFTAPEATCCHGLKLYLVIYYNDTMVYSEKINIKILKSTGEDVRLKIREICYDKTVLANSTFTVTMVVENEGSDATTFTVKILVEGELALEMQDSIEGNSLRQVLATLTAPEVAGVVKVTIVLTYDNKTITRTFNVHVMMPELEIGQVSYPPVVNSNQSFQVTVQIVSSSLAQVDYEIRIKVNGEVKKTITGTMTSTVEVVSFSLTAPQVDKTSKMKIEVILYINGKEVDHRHIEVTVLPTGGGGGRGGHH